MSQPTARPRRRKADRPKKPYPDFPLTPHASGKWQKKIRGSTYYFGRWANWVNGKLERVEGDGWREALDLYKSQADDLHAGRTPRVENPDGLTVADLCNRFLTAKLRKRESSELSQQAFADYKIIMDLIVATFGGKRLVEDLAADDFAGLRTLMTKRWGPVRLANSIGRVKSVLKFGIDNGLIEKAVRYGSEFRKPDKAVLRRHRAENGERMLEADQIRTIIDSATVPLKAMVLLGLNSGMGNTDCSVLTRKSVNLETGWLNFPRPKTGIPRRCPLWPETMEAIREALKSRTDPSIDEHRERVFLTPTGRPWVQTEDYRDDAVAQAFGALLKRTKLHRPGLGFYTLRHVFRTIADSARDPVAIDIIMGHSDPSMGGHYRERVDDARLVAVVDVVRSWLFAK